MGHLIGLGLPDYCDTPGLLQPPRTIECLRVSGETQIEHCNKGVTECQRQNLLPPLPNRREEIDACHAVERRPHEEKGCTKSRHSIKPTETKCYVCTSNHDCSAKCTLIEFAVACLPFSERIFKF